MFAVLHCNTGSSIAFAGKILCEINSSLYLAVKQEIWVLDKSLQEHLETIYNKAFYNTWKKSAIIYFEACMLSFAFIIITFLNQVMPIKKVKHNLF